MPDQPAPNLEEARRLARLVITHDYSPLATDTDAWTDAVNLARSVQDLLSEREAREEALLKELKHRCWQLAVHTYRGKDISLGEEADRHYAASLLVLPTAEPARQEPVVVAAHGDQLIVEAGNNATESAQAETASDHHSGHSPEGVVDG